MDANGGDTLYFEYGKKETEYLSKRDKKLGEAIERIGHIDRVVDEDLFSSIVHHILGQQISTAAQATLWKRLTDRIGSMNAQGLLSFGRENLQGVGTTFKKADYILDFAERVQQKTFDIDALANMSDEQVIQESVSYTHLTLPTKLEV